MLFHVEMNIDLPPDMSPAEAASLKSEEREMAQRLQREGVWRHLGRVAGRRANVGVFDVESPAHLQDVLSRLPLFPYTRIEVRVLCRHPSSIRDDSSERIGRPAVYRGMDRAALDAAYNNTQAVPDFPAIYARCRARSAALYAAHPCERDVAYGDGARQRFDRIACGRNDAPTFVFIHGGYWQNCTKEDFAFVAQGPLAHGFDVVLAEYTLAPDATMTQIVAEIGRLLDRLRDDPRTRGPLCLSGHSAGGHLTALYRAHPAVGWALPISALVDLEPIALCWLDDKLHLTPDEIERFSPIDATGRGAPMTVAVGADELPELVRHSREYALACAQCDPRTRYLPIAGCAHFSVLDELAAPDGALTRALIELTRTA